MKTIVILIDRKSALLAHFLFLFSTRGFQVSKHKVLMEIPGESAFSLYLYVFSPFPSPLLTSWPVWLLLGSKGHTPHSGKPFASRVTAQTHP